MKFAADFRRIARDALVGKWTTAVIAGLIASLLGGIDIEGLGFNVHIENSDVSSFRELVTALTGGRTLILSQTALGLSAVALICALTAGIALFLLGGIIRVGYGKFNLDLVDGQESGINTLFSYFSHWKSLAAARLLETAYILLGFLLLIVPGIIVTYSFAMTDYILAEHPEMSADEALTRSNEMMRGNRWRLFCLQFSFIGWQILSSLTFGIGNLWLTPYMQTATAAFYREISGTEPVEF